MWPWLVLGLILLVGCHPSVTLVPVMEPEPIYDPCKPPAGDEYPSNGRDPLWLGHAYDQKPTACI